jgi:hypothetical protein
MIMILNKLILNLKKNYDSWSFNLNKQKLSLAGRINSGSQKILPRLGGAMLAVGLFLVLMLSFNSTAHAATGDKCSLKKEGLLGIPTWYKYLEGQKIEVVKGSQTLEVCTVKFYGGDTEEDKLTSDPENTGDVFSKNLAAIGLATIEIFMRILIYLAIIWAIWGGYEMIVSGGNSQGFKNGVDRIRNALIGLIIGILSTSIVSFVATKLTT